MIGLPAELAADYCAQSPRMGKQRRAGCVHFASTIFDCLRKEVSADQSITLIEYSPEKAGVGGSTPSLATMLSSS
jgi:hypothetical protein